MIRFFSVSILLTGTLIFSGCATNSVLKPDPKNPIRSVALLPMVNNCLDIDAPVIVRSLLAPRLEKYFYSVKAQEETDLILKDQMGITLGSQLELATTRQLCELLGTDAVMYGSLDDFNQKITGIYNSKRVRIRLKMDSCASGQVVWKNGIGVKSETRAGDNLLQGVSVLGEAIKAVGAAASVVSSLSDKSDTELPALCGEDIRAPWEDISDDSSTAELNLVMGLGEKVVKKALASPLRAEIETALEILLSGYYDDGTEMIPHGMKIPIGPVEPTTPPVATK